MDSATLDVNNLAIDHLIMDVKILITSIIIRERCITLPMDCIARKRLIVLISVKRETHELAMRCMHGGITTVRDPITGRAALTNKN